MIEWIVSSSALIVLVVLLRLLLRGRIGLRLQYALWLLVLLRLLIPGTVGESVLSVQRPLQQAETQITQTPLPGNWAVMVVPSDGPAAVFPAGEGGGEAPSEPAPEPQRSTVGVLLEPLGALLEPLWHAGMALTGLLLVLSNLAFYRKLRRTRHLLDMDASTKIYVTDAIQSPCLFGLPLPAIYVPAAVAEDAQALRHVLAHELSHRRHADHIWTALRGVCLVLHWYNPLVWWAAALSRRDCELACDEAAVKRLGEAQRAAYGRTLVGLAEQHSGLLRCATSMSGSDLKERIAALVAKPTTRWAAAGVLAAAVVVFAVCTFTGAREPSRNWSTPEEFAAWVEAGSSGAATVQMRSTYEDGREYAEEAVWAAWVAENITNRFADYEWTRVGAADAADGLCLEVQMEGGNTLRLYTNDVAELGGPQGTVWYRAAYRYGPDVISDSIFAVCRERYDQQVLGSLTDLTFAGSPEGDDSAADALETLWNAWLARAVQKLPPDSRWGILDYRLDGTVTGLTTVEDGGDVRATWEMDVLVQPEDYENTFWWIGNAVGAEAENGDDYAGWIELGYQGWLIRDGESGRWSIPDFGTGAYTMEDLLTEYPPSTLEEEDVVHVIPYEDRLGTEGIVQPLPAALAAYIPAGAEVTGCGSQGADSWATFTWEDTAYTFLAREGYPSGNWLDILVDWKGLDTEDVVYAHSSALGLVDFYTSDQDTGAASWKWGDVTYVLETAGQTDAVEKLEALLAWCPEPLLGTSTSSSEEEAAVYVYEKEGFGGPFTIALYPDGTFQYYEGYLSSYIGFGTWEMDGNLLTLREHDYGLVNHFTITPEGLVFQAEGSDNFFYKEVAEGDRFLGPPLETEAGEEDI